MCFGLSLSWLERVKQHGSYSTRYAASERMNHLASFEGVVNSRILHNFYRHEHAFQIKEATSSGDVWKASLAGTDGMIRAAEYKNIKLKPMLENQVSQDIPFLTMVKPSGISMQDDESAFETFQSKLSETKRGIINIYSTEGGHALGFSSSDSGGQIIFDPSYGKFVFPKNDFKEMINTISTMNHLPLIGVQIFEAK